MKQIHMRKQLHWLFAALILLTVAATASAQRNREAPAEHTNRMEVFQNEELRQDFQIQGEYLADTGSFKMGLHLIADGGGKFRVVSYPDGLPGDGWQAERPRLLGTAELNGDEIAFNLTEGRGTHAGQNVVMPQNIQTKGKVTIETPQRGQGQGGAGQGGGAPRPAGAGMFRGNPVKIELPANGGMPAMTFEKQFRQSPTLGQEAPGGAVVIFDGTNLDKFQPGARMNEAQQRQGGGGAQQRPGAGNTLWAEAATVAFERKPYKMHLEFMLSYMPTARGQARSNSGVYIDERYELQVLDSFGLEGVNDECGGFYQVAAPKVNMCFPPLTWQTYDIEFTPPQYDGDRKTVNARVTVVHNGVVIHDNLELPQHTPGRRNEGVEPLGVYLQGHGNRVQYRNIWVQYKDEPTAQAAPSQAGVRVATEEATESQRGRRGAGGQRPLLQRSRQ